MIFDFLMNKNNVLRKKGKGTNPSKESLFYFYVCLLKNIEPKVFLIDGLEFETFHRLTCLSLGN